MAARAGSYSTTAADDGNTDPSTLGIITTTMTTTVRDEKEREGGRGGSIDSEPQAGHLLSW